MAKYTKPSLFLSFLVFLGRNKNFKFGQFIFYLFYYFPKTKKKKKKTSSPLQNEMTVAKKPRFEISHDYQQDCNIMSNGREKRRGRKRENIFVKKV